MAEYVQKFPGKINVAGMDSSEPVTAPQFNGNLNGNATNATNATVHSATLVPSNADLNTYRGENYWGKRFYAGGSNTVQNTPVAGVAFSLEVLRSGLFVTTQRIAILADVSNNRPTIFTRCVSDTTVDGGEGTWTAWTEVAEANGTYPEMEVGGAEYLSKRHRLQTNSVQQGWLKIGTAPMSTVATYQCYNCIMIISGVYRGTGAAATAPKTAIVEIESRKYASSLGDTRIGILAGDIPADSLCFAIDDNLDVSYYIYNNYTKNIDIQFEILSEELSNKTHANIFEFSADDTALASAPSGAQYAVVRNNASGDENGNGLMSHATRNELLNGTASYDFNDYIEWGHYELWGMSGTPLVNAPTSTSNPSATDADWYLDVYRRDSFYVTQIAYSARSDGAIAIRVLSNNSWGSWRVVIDSGTVPNATKATQDASGNVITSTYATKNELTSGLGGKANTSGSYPNLTVGKATNATNATTAATANTLAESGKYTLLWSGSWDGESNLVVPGLSNYCAILVRWGNRYYVCYKTTNIGTSINYGFTETLASDGGAVTITSLVLRTTATTSDVFSTLQSANINTAIIRSNTAEPIISSATISGITEIRGVETLRVPT